MRSRFEIAQTDAEQPWLSRFIGDNGEQIWRTSENYAHRQDAERAIEIWLAAVFIGDVALVRAGDTAQVKVINPADGGSTYTLSVPVIYLNERAA